MAVTPKFNTRTQGYWAKRADLRSDTYLADAEKVADEIGAAYYQAARWFNREVVKVFRGFKNAFNLSREQAKNLLKSDTNDKSVRKLLISAANLIPDAEERENVLNAIVSSQAYQYRIKRIETIADKAVATCNQLYNTELASITAFLGAETEKAYLNTIYDIQSGLGVSASFNVIPQSRIKEVLKTNWSGRHYSKSVWGDTQKLAGEIKSSMLKSFMTGASEQQAAADIMKRFEVGAYEARRLVRTENTYVTNQAELDSYNEVGVKYYQYSAHLDERTSDICGELNDKRFLVSDAVPGVNYPPMHPFCRSSTVAVMPSEEELNRQWDKQMRETLPEGVSFDEWLDKLEPTEDGKLVFKQKTTAKSAFVPAKNIKEAQEYAEKLGVKYADYSKFPLERANNMNMALSTLPDDTTPLMVTDLQKFSKVTGAPLGRAQKNGYAVTASPYEINPSVVGSSDARLEGSGETIVAANTRNFKTLDKLTENKHEYNEKYQNLKGHRWHFNEDGRITDYHEMGHVYAKKHGLPTGFEADAEFWYRETKLGLLKTGSEAWAEAYGAYYTHRNDLPDYIKRYFDDGEWKEASASKVLSYEEWQRKLSRITNKVK